EIFVMVGDAEPVGGNIEQARDAERGIDQESFCRDAGALPVALEQVVGQNYRPVHVAQEIVHAALDRLGQNGVVPGGDRLQEQFVEGIIDLEEIAVHRLQRVVVLLKI